MAYVRGQDKIWLTQLPIDYLDASLTIDDWETVIADLSEGKPARLNYVIVEQTNNGAAVETIELEITMTHPDTGVMTPYTITMVGITSGAPTAIFKETALVGGDLGFTYGGFRPVSSVSGGSTAVAGEGHVARAISLIRVRQTTGVDVTSAQIEVNIIWDKRERV